MLNMKNAQNRPFLLSVRSLH